MSAVLGEYVSHWSHAVLTVLRPQALGGIWVIAANGINTYNLSISCISQVELWHNTGKASRKGNPVYHRQRWVGKGRPFPAF